MGAWGITKLQSDCWDLLDIIVAARPAEKDGFYHLQIRYNKLRKLKKG